MKETKSSPFTPALQAAQGDVFHYVQHSCFLVISHDGYWARGKSVEETARNCAKEGARKANTCSVLLILGDETAEVNENGYIIRNPGSHNITVIERIRLGALIQTGRKERA
jgi:hypothetical protein